MLKEGCWMEGHGGRMLAGMEGLTGDYVEVTWMFVSLESDRLFLTRSSAL